MRRNSCAFVILLTSCVPALADDCPSTKSVNKGFVIERGERSATEVFHTAGPIVRTVMRSGGDVLLETT